jgi:hypothetical protein
MRASVVEQYQAAAKARTRTATTERASKHSHGYARAQTIAPSAPGPRGAERPVLGDAPGLPHRDMGERLREVLQIGKVTSSYATSRVPGGYHPNFVQCPSETTSTEPSTTLMAVCSSMA